MRAVKNNNLNVMMVAPDPTAQGGVVDFVAMLMDALANGVTWRRAVVGRRPGESSSRLSMLVRMLRDYTAFASACIRGHADVIHLNPSMTSRSIVRDTLFAWIAILFAKAPLYVFFHGWDHPVMASIKRGSLFKVVVRGWMRRCARIVVLSSDFKKELTDLGVDAERIFVRPTMFNGQLLQGALSSWGDEPFRVLFLSRVIVEKGILESIEAVAQLVHEGIRVELLVAGDGEALAEARQKASQLDVNGAVTFLGFVRGDEKLAAFSRSQAFLLPTRYGEGCPVSMLEAMGCGLPVITTTAGGIGEVVRDGANGYLLDEVSADSIAAAIRTLCADREKWQQMSGLNRKVAWDRYEAKAGSAMVLNDYLEVQGAAG